MESAMESTIAAILIGSYLIGSIPFGLLLTRAAGLGDIRSIGSGSIGATNVLRTGRKGLAALTLFFDAGKGAVAVLLARHWGGDVCAYLAALFAMLGHMRPVWLRFKGGKGVAVGLGILLALHPLVGLAAFATWLLVAALFRYSSLAALAAATAAPLYFLCLKAAAPLPMLAAALSALIILAHRKNIERLLQGQESKIGQKSTSAAATSKNAPHESPQPE